MDTVKIFIENWPKDSWSKEWMPIFIALIALMTSLISLFWTREQYEKSSRPYVWASNYGVIDAEKKIIIPIPFRVAFRVKNAPAKILKMTVEIKLSSKTLIICTQENFTRFPDETSEWSFDIGKEDSEKIFNRPNNEKSMLIRIVSLNYSPINGGKQYHFLLEQTFNPLDNQWQDVYETTD